jgi:anti-sigma factor RsiW
MNCEEARNFVECYSDGELDAVTSVRFESHLEHCVVCQQALERLSSLRVLIKEAVPYRPVPVRVAEQIRARVKDAKPARERAGYGWWGWLRPAALVAATAVVTWIAATHLYAPAPKHLVAEEVISSHARATLTGHLADVTSSERHTVKPWLSSKLDFSPPVTDLATAGFPLTGGRLDYIDRRPVAVLVYQRRQHVIDLFVSPHDQTQPVPKAQALSRNGFQVLNWTDGGMTFWAVSDLNAPELKIFADKFSSAK